MKNTDALNLLAMTADAEARHNAQLVEMIAVATAVKLLPPSGEDVLEVVIGQADIDVAMQKHTYKAHYDEAGNMTLRITRLDTN